MKWFVKKGRGLVRASWVTACAGCLGKAFCSYGMQQRSERRCSRPLPGYNHGGSLNHCWDLQAWNYRHHKSTPLQWEELNHRHETYWMTRILSGTVMTRNLSELNLIESNFICRASFRQANAIQRASPNKHRHIRLESNQTPKIQLENSEIRNYTPKL